MLRDLATLLAAIAIFIFTPSSMAAKILAAGTRLEARLSVPTGSRISHPGDPVEATVIAPVFADGRLLVPQGAIISGFVESVDRVGLGLKHLTSGIEYRFDTLAMPGGQIIPVEFRVIQVETAKERVNAQGMIGGIYPTANLSSSVAFYTLPLLCIDPLLGMPILGIKVVIARSPDPEIYFPAGTELILQLTAQAEFPGPGATPKALAPLPAADMAGVGRILEKLPQRTDSGSNQPSDLINILLLGSRDSIDRAFQAAGWSVAQRSSLRSIFGMYHCMVQRMGYRTAPMGNLTLSGVTADADYEKSLDTFSKRHHVRLWKQSEEGAWIGAATEDVSYAVRRMHLTHATDPLIDNERAKVLNDLAFTGCVNAATLMTRGSSAADQREQSISTDGKIAILRVNDCQDPRTMPGGPGRSDPSRRTRSAQALLALRDDLIRSNPVSLASNTIRLLRVHRDPQLNGFTSGFASNGRKIDSPENSAQPKWIRPSVLDVTAGTDDPHP